MQRIQSIDPKNAEGKTRELFDQVQSTFGMIPNTARVMANSPAVLESFLAISDAMGQAKIGQKLLNQVKLSTSDSNSCDYCTSILSAVAPSAGLSAADILNSRRKTAEDAKSRVALQFADSVLQNAGKISNEDLAEVRQAGFDDGEIVEIAVSVVLGCFTNFLNNMALTEIDVPKAPAVDQCAVN
jgi:alkylhydroperoxidase family enzyme